MSSIKRTLVLAALLLVSGCKQAPPVIAYTPPVLAESWSVKMDWSGGIMGLLRNIVVQSDGGYTVTDERANSTVAGNLTESELAALKETIATLKFTPPEIQAVCADCFVYNLEIESGGKKMLVRADDNSLEGSGIEDLVQFLRGLTDAALK